MYGVTFNHKTPKLCMGSGALMRLPEEVEFLHCKRALLITDDGIVKAGIADRIENILASTGIICQRFADVIPDPLFEIADAATEKAKSFEADLILGLGGGSSMDIAKIASVLMTNEGLSSSYFGVDLVARPGIKNILIPTTAGTGSEVTPIVILSDDKEMIKRGIISPHLIPDTAILDPELTIALPPNVTAESGMDALIHAVEAFTSNNATIMSDLFAEKAIKLIYDNIRSAFANGENYEARANMMKGSLLAGMAFANAGVTAVHAFAYPIGAKFHIPHGMANSIMLPPVMEFNIIGNLHKFARIAGYIGICTQGYSLREVAVKCVKEIKTLTQDLRIPQSLGSFGVKEEHVSNLADGVMKVKRLLANNPRRLEKMDAEEIYRKAL